MNGRCPYCGATVRTNELTYRHPEDGKRGNPRCPGSRQIPRALTDHRPTWRDEDTNGALIGEWAVRP